MPVGPITSGGGDPAAGSIAHKADLNSSLLVPLNELADGRQGGGDPQTGDALVLGSQIVEGKPVPLWTPAAGGGGAAVFPIDAAALDGTMGDDFAAALGAQWNDLDAGHHSAPEFGVRAGKGMLIKADLPIQFSEPFDQSVDGLYLVHYPPQRMLYGATMPGIALLDATGNGIGTIVVGSQMGLWSIGDDGTHNPSYVGYVQSVTEVAGAADPGPGDLWLAINYNHTGKACIPYMSRDGESWIPLGWDALYPYSMSTYTLTQLVVGCFADPTFRTNHHHLSIERVNRLARLV